MQSAGRDESRAPAETRSVSKQRRKARAKTRAMTAKCSSSCGALYYIERAQRLPWCCKWRVISTSTPTCAERGVHLAPLAPLILAAYARYCIRRAFVTTQRLHLLRTLIHAISKKWLLREQNLRAPKYLKKIFHCTMYLWDGILTCTCYLYLMQCSFIWPREVTRGAVNLKQEVF